MRQKLYEYVMDPGSEISDDVLYEITWSAFYFAADTLLDMLLYIKQNKKETSKTKSKVISQGPVVRRLDCAISLNGNFFNRGHF
jgi:hypothetical protein